MDQTITAIIQSKLGDLQNSEGVQILLAIESGSRAWGFASQDSDYDVRFIYIRPRDDYLRINRPRDVIELPIVDDLDINGWDVQKALLLLQKSNPPLLEWLSSPIIYQQHASADILRQAAKTMFDPVKTSHHYLSMAIKNHQYLQTALVRRKKYLYVLRPLFCLDWITTNKSTPPMLFSELREFTKHSYSDEVDHAITDLLAAKTAGKETDKQPRDAVLDAYIRERLAVYSTADLGRATKVSPEQIEIFFKDILNNVW